MANELQLVVATVPGKVTPTFVCQIVIEVLVITAKMCPALETRKARMGSWTGMLGMSTAGEDSSDSLGGSSPCSTGWIPGVPGVIGVGGT